MKAGLAIVLTAAIAGGLAAQAPGPRPGRPDGPGGPGGPGRRGMGPMGPGIPLGQLGLSDDQQAQVRDVMERYRPEVQALGERMRPAHDAQRKAIETVPLNEALVRSTSEAVGAAETEMAVLQARQHNDVFAILTPEQQKKAAQINQRLESRMGQRQERIGQRQEQLKNRLQQRLK